MRYEEIAGRSFRDDGENGPELMANFTARIVKETRYVDGAAIRSVLIVTGQTPKPGMEIGAEPEMIDLPPVEVPTDEFAGMSWVVPNWGVRCVIRPGAGIKDDLRTMIQLESTPDIVTVYGQTGWQDIKGKPVYLHTGGGITAKGNDPSVQVRLPPELSRYDLTTDVTPQDAVNSTLDLACLCDADIMWPLVAATLAPLYGPCDFAVHISGRTGSFKSELASLLQSHYGAGMDARRLPASWSSTPNALEALAYKTANAPIVIDDFVPGGTSWQQRMYQQNADKIIRAQGNQAGRARLTDTSGLQQTMYPRGLILSTGEDTPEGHSVRARMLILELATGDITPDALTQAQQARPNYVGTVAWLAQQLAADPAGKANVLKLAEDMRANYRDIGHSRTPGMIGRLVATAHDFVTRAAGAGLVSSKDATLYKGTAQAAIEAAGRKQQQFLEDSDPVDQFLAAIRQVLASGGGHFRTLNGGVPKMAALLGWTEESSSGEMTTYKARGPVLGWCKVPADELYLDMTAGYSVIRKAAGAEIALSKQTLMKRMKDAGTLLRTDEGRQRNTIRVSAENHPRQVICLSLSSTLQQEDLTDETE